MEMGDAAAWAAFAISAVAGVISYRAQRDGRKSAEEARLSRLASERSAAVAEAQLADQRQEAAERRAAEAEAARPRPDFVIERKSQHMFYLRNVGTGPATGVTLIARQRPYIFDPVANADMGPHDAEEFRMAGAGGSPVPGTLYLTWDGQSEEVAVTVPR
ncbi:hypothetical protein ACGFZC_07475 [[Kitasatospora] papulosa]|uniref:hypothetical protein n=1 Tax=[Kitasatospora] papulosa TaxID=1464011 RepID=UPI00371F2933